MNKISKIALFTSKLLHFVSGFCNNISNYNFYDNNKTSKHCQDMQALYTYIEQTSDLWNRYGR